MMRWALFSGPLLLLTMPASAAAQEASQGPLLPDPRPADTGDRSAPDQDAASTPVVWVAGVSGGLLDRDGGASSPFGTASVTAYRGSAYLRGAFTVYRGTLEQIDAALPSTYYICSLGAGGNFNRLLVDAYASFGTQHYGLVETMLGTREPQGLDGSGYLSGGLRAGYFWQPGAGWYVTPTAEIQYVATRSLRHRIADGMPVDFEAQERALTGNLAVRVDRSLGSEDQHLLGFSIAQYVSNNGLTVLAQDPADSSAVIAARTPDNWWQSGVASTFRLRDNLWLDLGGTRTLGAVSGDSTTISAGLRMRL